MKRSQIVRLIIMGIWTLFLIQPKASFAQPETVLLQGPGILSNQYQIYIVGGLIFIVFQLLIIIVLWINITRRKQAKEAQRESEERFRGVFETSPTGIAIVDTVTQRFLEANNSFLQILGYSLEELQQLTVMDVTHPEDWEKEAEVVRGYLEGSLPRYIVEKRYICKDSQLRWVRTTGDVMLLDPDEPPLAIANVEDITDRKRTEEALRESEEGFRQIYEHMTVGLARVALDFRIEAANEAYCRMLGYSEQELIGKHLKDITHPETIEENLRKQSQLARGEIDHYRMEKQFIHKSGRVITGILDANLIRDAAGQPLYFLGSVLDITDRKQIEEALRQSEEKFRLIAETSAEDIWQVNLDGQVIYASPAVQTIFGYTPQEALGLGFSAFFPETEIDRAAQSFTTAISGQKYQLLEFTGQRKDGSLIPIEVSITPIILDGTIVGVQGIARDITERKQAEESLRQNEALLNRSQALAHIGSWELDLLTNQLTWSDEVYRIFGLLPQEFEATYEEFLEAVHPDDRAAVDAAYSESLHQGRDGYQIEHRLIRRDSGEVRVVREKCEHIKDASGRIVRSVGMVQDITERKQAEEEKARLEEQFRQAQKLESIGRLAGGVAHDFNNMLSVIIGHTEMAQAQVDPTRPLFADLEEIRKAADRSANLTRQLLAFARRQLIAPQVLDLNETVEGMLRMLRRLIGEHIDLAWLPRTGVWPVKVDPSQIDQILANLCINARDAIQAKGKVTIETENVVIDQEYCATHAEFISGEFVLLAVSDDGCGMDRDTLANIFEPFFSTKKINQGTGLGLATVHGIVKQNNGFINVYSEPGQGTTFKIYLPRHLTGIRQRPEESQTAPAGRGHETILLVEDDPSILNMGQLMLERLGYQVLAAATPSEAIEMAREHPNHIHLLITDVIMPEMNGQDLAKSLLSLYPNLRYLFMSGYTANVIAHHGVLEEGIHFIQKPFSMQALAVKVRQVLDS